MVMKFDAVLFDCDGVLVDSEPIVHRVLCHMLREQGWQLSEEECHQIFVGKLVRDERARIERETGRPMTDAWLADFYVRRNAALEDELLIVQHALPAVHAVHSQFGGRIACASGADRYKVQMQLRKVGLYDYFDGRIFSGHEMPRSKPHPDVYLAAAAALGAHASRCAVVEDSLIGLTAGVAAGATVFAYVPHGDASAHLQAGAAHVMRSMSELPALLAAA